MKKQSSITLINLNSLPGLKLGNLYPIGPVYLASYLKQKHIQVRIVDFVQEPDQLEHFEFLQEKPDFIGCSIRTMDSLELNSRSLLPAYQKYLNVLKKKIQEISPLTKLLLGGTGFTLYSIPLKQRLDFDIGITHYAEETISQIVTHQIQFRCRKNNIISGSSCIHGKAPTRFDHSLIQTYLTHGNSEIGLQTFRGPCPFNCIYCAYGNVEGECTYAFDLQQLERDIRTLYSFGVRRFFFTDSVFNSISTRAKKICQMLINLNLNDLQWSAYFLPTLDLEELVLIQESGCKKMILSFDSFSPTMLRRYQKSFTLDSIKNFLQLTNRLELQVGCAILFGGPGENHQTIQETCAFANHHIPSDNLFYSFGVRIQPGSPLARIFQLCEEDLLPPTFLYFPEQMFDWVLDELDSRFMRLPQLCRLISLRSGYLDMERKNGFSNSDFSIIVQNYSEN